METTESKLESPATVRAGEFKTTPALRRGSALLTLFLGVALLCVALPAAAQTLIVDQNPAYVGDPLTFTYTPADSCLPDPEAVDFERDLTIYEGGITQFYISMSLNPDGTFTGTYTTTDVDVGNNWVEVDDDCDNVTGFYLPVLEFGYWYVLSANWVANTDVAAVKHPGGNVTVEAVPYPDYINTAAVLYDWSESDDGINWNQPSYPSWSSWGGCVSKDDPCKKYFCVSLDDYQTWNWLNVWVISVEPKVIQPQPVGPTGSAAKYVGNTPINGPADNLFATWPNEQLNINIQLRPAGFTSVIPTHFIQWSPSGIDDNTIAHTFTWSTTGTEKVTISIPSLGSSQDVYVDVPDVGTTSEVEAAAACTTYEVTQMVLYHDYAASYAASRFGDNATRDAYRHSFWNALCVSDPFIFVGDVEMMGKAHEYSNNNHDVAVGSTMDLHNNGIGRGIIHMTLYGRPDEDAILNDIFIDWTLGLFYIWDGVGNESASQGILSKSDGRKIY